MAAFSSTKTKAETCRIQLGETKKLLSRIATCRCPMEAGPELSLTKDQELKRWAALIVIFIDFWQTCCPEAMNPMDHIVQLEDTSLISLPRMLNLIPASVKKYVLVKHDHLADTSSHTFIDSQVLDVIGFVDDKLREDIVDWATYECFEKILQDLKRESDPKATNGLVENWHAGLGRGDGEDIVDWEQYEFFEKILQNLKRESDQKAKDEFIGNWLAGLGRED